MTQLKILKKNKEGMAEFMALAEKGATVQEIFNENETDSKMYVIFNDEKVAELSPVMKAFLKSIKGALEQI